MAAQKKNYTNADIIKRLDDMGGQLEVLWNDKLVRDAGRAAVDEYKRQEASERADKSRDGFFDSIKDLMPYIILVLGGLAALIYAYASRTH